MEALSLFACAGELALLTLVVVRGVRSPYALPLALLSAVLFTWNFCALAFLRTGYWGWHWLDVASSPLTTPLALHVLLAFAGLRRKLGWLLAVSYAYFGALFVAGLLAFALPWAQGFVRSPAWDLGVLGGSVPLVVVGVAILLRHLRRTPDPAEKHRARLMLAAMGVVAVAGVSELLAGLGLPCPPLGNAGTLIFNGLIAVAALRLNLFDRALASGAWVLSAVLAALGVFGAFAGLRWMSSQVAVGMLAAAAAGMGALAAARQLALSRATHRTRTEAFTSLGRLSSQMAHDLKNPLAALKGATQFLQGELKAGRSLDAQGEFIELLAGQVERLERVINDYQRLAKVEAVLRPGSIHALTQRVLALQVFASTAQVSVVRELEDDADRCQIDEDLLAAALENLLRNALQAMPSGGTLTVRLRSGEHAVVLSIEDTGRGMNPRERERAFEEFFTTKFEGTGLGLAFVRRVAEAHGGEVSLQSREGVGTRVELRIPAARG